MTLEELQQIAKQDEAKEKMDKLKNKDTSLDSSDDEEEPLWDDVDVEESKQKPTNLLRAQP
jgi:hypothetical protein